MSTIANRFISNDNVKVTWHHSNGTTCREPINVGYPDNTVPQIGGNAGYLILQAVGSTITGNLEPIESFITLYQFSPYGHKIILSYDHSTFEWKVESNKIGPNGKKQIDVNVEIGPKIS
jgi:hypothetical protein